MNQKQKGFIPVIIGLIILGLVTVSGSGYYIWNKNKEVKKEVAPSSKITTEEEVKENLTIAIDDNNNCELYKARGIITVYNNGNSSISLISGTRFLFTDDKIFRSIASFTVPNGKNNGEKFIPGEINVEVVADQLGQKYNIGPSDFSFPGLSGTEFYDKIYGKSFKPMNCEKGKEKKQELLVEQKTTPIVKDSIDNQTIITEQSEPQSPSKIAIDKFLINSTFESLKTFCKEAKDIKTSQTRSVLSEDRTKLVDVNLSLYEITESCGILDKTNTYWESFTELPSQLLLIPFKSEDSDLIRKRKITLNQGIELLNKQSYKFCFYKADGGFPAINSGPCSGMKGTDKASYGCSFFIPELEIKNLKNQNL